MKKVLIITYYWPPAGGPGVQRWLKFVKYLPEFGIEPIIYTPDNPSYPLLDESLEDEVPKGIKVLKQVIREPYKFASTISKKDSETISKGIIHKPQNQSIVEKLLLFIRGNCFIPDARKSWVKPSVKFLTDYLSVNPVDTIITTGPPHSMHLIGSQIKDKMGVKWIADFRDPWTTIGYHSKLRLTNASQRKHIKLESQVLTKADNLIVTSSRTKKEFELKTKTPISVITNGYDVSPTESVTLDKKFTLAHIGSLLSERNPEILWDVLGELVSTNKVFESLFQLTLIGAVSNEILRSLEKYELSGFVNLKGYVSHSEAIKYQKTSQLLLLIEIDSEETKCIIPGKLFEYMVSNRPILALGPEESDVEQIIKSTNSGMYFNYSKRLEIKETILTYFKAFREGKLQSHPIGLQQYSRKQLTKKLSKVVLAE